MISMINGAHIIIASTDAEKDRNFFRDVLKLPNVDAGDGWLIFGLPPAEAAIHPAAENNSHELYLMCNEIREFISEMTMRNIPCSEATDHGWGIVARITLPGGGNISVYQPRHLRPE